MEALLNDSIILISLVTVFLVGLNAYLARSMGRSELNWLFLTLAFGIFATLMLILAREDESQPM